MVQLLTKADTEVKKEKKLDIKLLLIYTRNSVPKVFLDDPVTALSICLQEYVINKQNIKGHLANA